MEELKAIAYDAEDILDEYSYELLRKHHQNHQKEEEKEYYKSSTVLFNKVRNIFSKPPSLFVVSWKLPHKVKKINEKFDKIAKCMGGLGKSSPSSSSHKLMMKNRETDSLVVNDWKFVGREKDKSALIKMLLEEEENINQGHGGGKHVSVIPIVGMGGLGKTTMAQHVYNDEAVQKHFDINVWICVSNPFDIEKLWKNIANSIGIIDMADRACSLQDAFRGKKFILVLDDVWNENPTYWNHFKKPFMVGREGSKILVTTRSEKVALIMVDKFQPYPLGILKENDCWSLFKQIAFGSIAAGAEETSNLVEIGKVMVKRCGGLPLAVIYLGSMMRSKKKEEEWKIIRDTKLWHESREGKNSEILPSLRLSYDYLPSHLKLCFSYCCLFPKDYIFERETLIRLWMAEGFLIESPGENAMSMEEIGNEYFHSLLSSSFFQDVKRNKDGDIATCKMHDLVHDLARSVVGKNECLIVENAHDIDCISEETRRLNVVNLLDDEETLAKVLEAVRKAKNLRTILVKCGRLGFDIGNAFKENKRLRVLALSGYHITTAKSSDSTSSSSIGGLKHLRYLDVYGDSSFPKGIGRLSFLQTLRHFTVGDKNKQNKNAGGGGGGGIEELEGLNLLTGDLSINNLHNVRSGTDACRANLKEKKNLRRLILHWGGRDKGNNNHHHHEVVLEGLRPHPNLRTLDIHGFKGAKLPSWIQEDSSCLPNLVELTLFNCKCEQIAGFGALPSLRTLTLERMDTLECIGNEFYYSAAAGGSSSSSAGGGGGSSSSSTASTGEASTAAATTTIPFPSLKKLSLKFMRSLKEWVVPAAPLSTTGGDTTTNCFPLLEELTILHCPLLTTITPPTTTTTTIFPSLKVLNLQHMDGSAAKPLVTNNLNSLTFLTLYDIPNLISLPRQGLMENNNTLLSLEIVFCSQFKGFFPRNNEEEEGHDDDDNNHQGGGGGGGGQQLQQISQVVSSSSSSSLQSLTLFGCPAVRSYPNIRSLTSLRTLEIQEWELSPPPPPRHLSIWNMFDF